MADQEEGTLYERMVKQIAEIEASTARTTASTIDISESFSDDQKKGTASYKSILSIIEEVERKGSIFQRQKQQARPLEQPKQAQEVQAAPPQPSIQAAQQVQAAQPTVHQEELAQQPAVKPAQQEAVQDTAAKELAELTKELPVHVPRFGIHKIKMVKRTDLVLPNLSLQDQVAELERILDGVRSGVLHKDDLQTVKTEVYGLAGVVNDEKKAMKKGAKPPSDEYAMLALRDQRIEEVMAALQQREKAGE